jgi:bla regulator protein BlaR1
MTLDLLLSHVAVHVWQSTLFAILVALAMASLLRGREARVRHAVWLAASLKFLVPFDVLRILGASIGSVRPPVAPMPEPIRGVLEQTSGIPAMLIPQADVAGPAAVSTTSIVLAVWVVGTVVVLMRWMGEWRQVQRYAHGAMPMTMVDGLPVLSSPLMRDERCEPGLFGVLGPVILVPEGITNRLTAAEFDAVLAHEACHARRRDNVAAAIQSAVEVIFWFHPLVWWLGRRLRDERERACDEALIGGGVDLDTYARAILSTCRFYVESRCPAVAGIGGANLRRRVEGIALGRLGRRLTRAQYAAMAGAASLAIAAPIALGVLSTTLIAQAGNSFIGLQTSATRTFDVASVKVNRSGESAWRLGAPKQGTESIYNLELRKIVASSFRIQDKMVIGPGWIDNIRYDIEAKGSPTANSPEVWEMMRSLLAERFRLKYHLETRPLTAYVLVVARGGHKLVKGENGECAEAVKTGASTCDAIQFLPFGIGIRNMPLAALAAGLARSLQDFPVVDRTGLAGRYDARVLWRPDGVTPEQLAGVPGALQPPDVNMYEAFEQQAGLKIEARREPVEVLVIDDIQPADEN